MKAVLYAAPTVEPISLTEFKLHGIIDSETLDGNISVSQSLSYGSHAIANDYVTHVGTGIDVLGKQAEVLLHCGTNGAGGTIDTRIEESDQLVTGYTAWAGGAFTQVTTANDNTDFKKQYTGSKRYIRTASKVLSAACEFGTSILVNAATNAEDDLLTAIITAGREVVEGYTRRALLTQYWDFYLQSWPKKNYIKLPFGNLQSIDSIKYKDTAGVETTMTVGSEYVVETNGEGIGRIVLPYNVNWPSVDLYPSNPITIRMRCGWTSASVIPSKIKTAIKMICLDLFENREGQVLTENSQQIYAINKTVQTLLYSYILWDEF